AAGPGLIPRTLVGRRVACGASFTGDGTWAEYAAVPTTQCFPLFSSVTDEQAASMIVNPMTAWALMEPASGGGHQAAVPTAAASQLGRMIVGLARQRDFPLLNIVRRAEQVALLRSLGAEHVLDSSQPDFDERLPERCKSLGVTIAFDAVSGELAQKILGAML